MLRVLVVDDEPAVRDTVSRALKRAGHEAVAVANGRAGVSAIAAGRFDAVVTDVCLPEGDCIELVRTLRAAERPVPVLAISGGGAGAVRGPQRMSAVLGASATLSKPFAPAELVAAVEAISAG